MCMAIIWFGDGHPAFNCRLLLVARSGIAPLESVEQARPNITRLLFKRREAMR